MSTLATIPAAVKSDLHASVARFVADLVAEDRERMANCRAYVARLAVQTDAEAPADADDRAPYSADDQAWWAAHCDHAGWTHPGELSPDEQDAELEYNDRLNAAYEAAYEADMIETGIPCW